MDGLRYTYAHNNPGKYVDPDGRLIMVPLLYAAAKTALVAGGIGATGYILFSPEEANAPDVGDATKPRRTTGEFAADTAAFGVSAAVFHSLFDAELLSVDGVAELVPRFDFVLDDISRASDEELMRRAERETARIVPVVLWAMRDARAGERLVASVAAWQGLLQHVWQAPSGRAALVEVFRYISLVGDRLSRDNLIEVAGAAAPDAKEVVMTLAEQWIAEGRAEGRAEGERIVLLRLLRLKFGELPASAQAQVAHANEEQLSLWAERVLTASSLDEVLA